LLEAGRRPRTYARKRSRAAGPATWPRSR